MKPSTALSVLEGFALKAIELDNHNTVREYERDRADIQKAVKTIKAFYPWNHLVNSKNETIDASTDTIQIDARRMEDGIEVVFGLDDDD